MNSVDWVGGADQGRAVRELDRFRGGFFRGLGRRADELFELLEALLCAEGPVQSLVGLCLTPEHRRGHGALYDALNCGTVDADRLRGKLTALPPPRMFGGRIVLAVDSSGWLRPDAPTCPDRLFCHVYGRGRDADQRIPGWPYQVVAALDLAGHRRAHPATPGPPPGGRPAPALGKTPACRATDPRAGPA